MDINNEQFVTLLRSALHYLYDPDQLRRSPLADLLDVSNRVDASFALQKILIDAIEGIQPPEDDLPQSRAWLLHDVLFFRYVRGYERQAVANQLGISDRQLSRDQRAALETLAQYLWKTYHLEESSLKISSSDEALESAAPSPLLVKEESGEASWIDELPVEKNVPWKATLHSVLDLLRPMIVQNEVQLVFEPVDALPDLLAPQNALRHSLLNILGEMIPLVCQGQLFLVPQVMDQVLTITVSIPCANSILPAGFSLLALPSMAVAQQLIERVGGSLSLLEEGASVKLSFTIPALAQIPVLVIDDNTDIIHLFQRYAQGTRYSVEGASGPAEFFQLIDQIHPSIILMDVMMPDLDGWDLLSQLRQERQVHQTALVICSILPQESLARALGADGFLQKPVMPRDFLRVLDEQMDNLGGVVKEGPEK